MEWYVGVLKKYVEFNGRARRKEYWMFFLVNFAIAVGLGMVDGVIQAILDTSVTPFGSLYSLAVLLPSLAVGVRRLHDTGRSGWYLLISLIPIVGTILVIVWLAKEGDHGPNQYGPDPKEYEGVTYAPAPVAPAPFGSAAPPVPPQPVAPPVAPTAAAAPAGWLADPSGRHEFRYWDGSVWTGHVSDQGVTGTDPI